MAGEIQTNFLPKFEIEEEGLSIAATSQYIVENFELTIAERKRE